MELLGDKRKFIFNLWPGRDYQIVSKAVVPFYILPSNIQGLLFLSVFASPTVMKIKSKFSSKSFRVLAFMIRSLIHLKLIFGYGVIYSWCSFFLINIQLFQRHFLKRFSSPHWVDLELWLQIKRSHMCASISRFLYYSIDLLVYPYAKTTLSWLLQLYSKSSNMVA